jgi:DNA phosphorothioation-dependent restriction protein DptG
MADNLEIEDCVTMAQFNELKRSMEEKHDQLSQDLQALMAQLRNFNNIPEAASNLDETDEEVLQDTTTAATTKASCCSC